jgi:hypothetical protein
MSVVNSKKVAPSSQNAALAGAVARIRRGGLSPRNGRRSALLGVLTSMYANTSRGNGTPTAGRTSAESRTGNGTDRS